MCGPGGLFMGGKGRLFYFFNLKRKKKSFLKNKNKKLEIIFREWMQKFSSLPIKLLSGLFFICNFQN